ncbi:hypothetical protein D3P08_07280 [Paenibacillus nanensis]|uniref:Pilus assembly protein PilO n=1 Tax=Paenibacillus nanensis TaxID=393251 RepID=A0A3A1V035_9BACL|nr:hypothetical protein [Paenibacillus nanensis]RIX54047.1 hypothetical protein D3P08_07280 [Paenibacillus nanensis]
MSLNKSQSMSIIAIIAMFLLLLVIFLIVLRPSFKEVEEQKRQVAQLEEQNAMLQKVLANKKEKTKDLPDDVQKALPLWDNTEQMVVSMKELAAATNTSLSSISFSVSDTNQIQAIAGGSEPLFPTVGELKVQTVIQGAYSEVRGWLVELQKLPRVVNVDSVRYSVGASGEMSAEVNFTGYYDPTYAYMLENPIMPTPSTP